MAEFVPFPKIPRLRRDVIVTEKIDGTNAAINIDVTAGDITAQSRKRIITPESDNFGFARWVDENKDALIDLLGEGLHFGEWWGSGIQRGYGLGTNGKQDRRFSLFNSGRWTPAYEGGAFDEVPALRVVPILGIGPADETIDAALSDLREGGSMAEPDWMRPEGIVVYHTAARTNFKVLLEGDELAKSAAA